jgi:hypothetical protein
MNLFCVGVDPVRTGPTLMPKQSSLNGRINKKRGSKMKLFCVGVDPVRTGPALMPKQSSLNGM